MHPAGVVMGSRWLVVPTPTAQFIQVDRESKSLHALRVCRDGVSQCGVCPTPAYLAPEQLPLYGTDESSDIRTDRQVEAFVGC